jgi:hypothetical protein
MWAILSYFIVMQSSKLLVLSVEICHNSYTVICVVLCYQAVKKDGEIDRPEEEQSLWSG